ncbi:MAG: DsbA family oxidoreductase [Rhodospirillaceae bacterium]|nr:DsbA family oxidoreductase [Rhodospirillaceae bacterium]
MRIDIFSDVICPWCLIGRERLRQALEQLDPEQPVAIRWLPFELNPEMPREGMDRRDYAEAKFGGIDQAREIYANIAEAGRAEGIEFDFSRLQRTPSTFNAHRLLWLASSKGLGDLLKDGLFRAYFMEARDIGDLAVLTELATAAGMDADEVGQFLDSDNGEEAVRQMESVAYQMGITGVPFFIFNGRIGVSGAQSPEVLLQAIGRAWDPLPDEATAESAQPDG